MPGGDVHIQKTCWFKQALGMRSSAEVHIGEKRDHKLTDKIQICYGESGMKWTKLIVLGLFLCTSLFAGAALINPSQTLAATYTVTKTADTDDGTCDADCSLREAIAAANTNAGHDTIEFNVPTSDANYDNDSDTWTVTLDSALSILANEGVALDGSTQSGNGEFPEYGGKIVINTNAGGTISVGTGANLVITQITFRTTASNNSLITGSAGEINIQDSYFLRTVAPTTTNYAVFLGSSGNVVFSNNKIELFRRGFGVTSSNSLSTIAVLENMLINSTSIGINVSGHNHSIKHNVFTSTVPDQGIISACQSGTCTIQGNKLVVPNAGNWAAITASGSGEHIISDNMIDTKHDIGISISTAGIVENNTISGASYRPGEYGKIRVNTSEPVVVRNNVITASDAIPVLVVSSEAKAHIYNNIITTTSNYAPIDLRGGVEDDSGVTANDPGDTDTGPNDLMNYPEIQGAEYLGNGRYKIWGWLEGNLAEAPFTIELCKSSAHPSGHGGCLEPLGTITTSERMWSMEVTVSGDNEGSLSTFTALATNANGSTSEFGPNFGGSIHGPGAPAPTPNKPDLLAMHSGFVHRQEVLSFAPPATFLWDVYLDVAHTPQAGTKRVSGAYWQTSGIYNVWYKSFFNDAKILPEVIASPYLLAFRYDPTKLEPNLPEKNLRLAYSEDGEVWKVLSNSVLDMVNKTVALVTKQGGYYMLVSGYPF